MDTVRYQLASRLKNIRKSKGLSQAALAEVMGCEINTISRYETGINAPSVEHLLRLADALDVSPMDILPPKNPTVQRLFKLRVEISEKLYEINNPENLEKLLVLADAFISSEAPSKP